MHGGVYLSERSTRPYSCIVTGSGEGVSNVEFKEKNCEKRQGDKGRTHGSADDTTADRAIRPTQEPQVAKPSKQCLNEATQCPDPQPHTDRKRT